MGHQLGHAPGSPMTRRYAEFTFAAEQGIVNKAEQGLASLLKLKGKTANHTGLTRDFLLRHCCYWTQLRLHCFFVPRLCNPLREQTHPPPLSASPSAFVLIFFSIQIVEANCFSRVLLKKRTFSPCIHPLSLDK